MAEQFNVGVVSLTWLRQPAQAWCDGQSVRVVAARVGIGIQSPVGDGCTAEFDRISLTAARLDDQFDGG